MNVHQNVNYAYRKMGAIPKYPIKIWGLSTLIITVFTMYQSLLSIFLVTSVIPSIALGRGYYYPHFVNEEIEVEHLKAKMLHYLGSHRQHMVELEFQNNHPGPGSALITTTLCW